MFLKSLEIQGFKSFADKVVLQFGKGVTAVVGPNGSGKSNLSDAIRWVLGEQSTKSLRGAKMEDVIFGGTATRKALGYAEVTICFDNTDRALPCDTDEVAVTRRYYRSGDSEYRINRASVRLKDVNDLFMDTGVGRDGYSMIGQGKISDIVGRRSEERRDMFEEAAGISRYRYRRQEAERKLAGAEENMVRLLDIQSELEARVGPLKTQSDKAERFLTLSEEKRTLEIGLWLDSLERAKDVLREQQHKIDLARSQYDEAGRAMEGSSEETERLSQQMQNIAVEIDNLRRAASAWEEEATRTDGEVAVGRNTIEHHNETIGRLRGEMERLGGSDAELLAQIQAGEEEIQRREQALLQKKEALAAASAELEELLQESMRSSGQAEEINRTLSGLAQKRSEWQLRQAAARSSLEEIDRRSQVVSQTKELQAVEAARMEEEVHALEQDLTRCKERMEECRNAEAGRQMRLKSRRERSEELKKQADSLSLDAQTRQKRAQMLEELEKNLEGFAYAVKEVMKAAERGQLSGVRGPVSRLISVDGKYATAVEIALGAAMQNIVVETEADAKRAIARLKEQRSGRGTFLPMSSIKGRVLEEKGLDGCAGFVGVAAELISFDPQYREIVNSLLGRVAVVEDLDAAVAIARRYGYRFRVVTLDGQVVNAGGSLTGGSLSKNAGLLARAGEIEAIRLEAKKLFERAEQAREGYRAAAAEQAKEEAELLALRSEMTTVQEDAIRCEAELRRVQSQLTAARQTLEELRQEEAGAASRREELDQTIRQANEAQEEMIEESAVWQAKLDALTGGRDALSQRREELGDRCSALRMEQMAQEKDMESIRASLDDMTRRRADSTGSIGRIEQEMAEVGQRIVQQEERIAELTAHAKELREQAKSCEEQIGDCQRRRQEMEQQTVQLRSRERENMEKRERLSSEIARLEERRDALSRQNEELVAKLYDEYSLTRSEAEAMNIDIGERSAASRRLGELKSAIRSLGSVNVAAIEEYKEVAERYRFYKEQIDDVQKAREELTRLIRELTGRMEELFVQSFEEIRGHFSNTFVDLFGGGTAELSLTDASDPLASGIEIRVQPPGKKVSNIEQLSGGEKSLVAIAIYFAIMKVSPPPFCMLDEVESALDDVNVDRFAGYLRRMCGSTQFIAVTHRRGTMEEADVLYGVTMQEKGVSKVLEMNVNEIEKKLGIA